MMRGFLLCLALLLGCSGAKLDPAQSPQSPSLKERAEGDLGAAALYFAEQIDDPTDRGSALFSIAGVMAASKHPLTGRARRKGLQCLPLVKDLWSKGLIQNHAARILLTGGRAGEALQMAESIALPSAKTSALVNLAQEFAELNDEAGASDCLAKALTESERIVVITERVHELHQIAKLYARGRSTKGQQVVYRKIVDAVAPQMDQTLRRAVIEAALGLARLGDVAYSQKAIKLLGEPELFLEHISQVTLLLLKHVDWDKSAALVAKLIDPYQRAQAQIWLFERYPTEEAEQLAEASIGRIYIDRKRVRACVQLAALFQRRNLSEKAQSWLATAQRIAHQKDRLLAAFAAAAIAAEQRDWAVQPLQAALNLAGNIPDPSRRAKHLLLIGQIYLNGNGKAGAVLAARGALEALQKARARSLVKSFFSSVQEIFVKTGHRAPADLDALIRLGYRLHRQLKSISVLPELAINLAKLNQPARARRVLTKNGDTLLQRNAFSHIVHGLAKSANVDAAMHFAEHASTLNGLCEALTWIAHEMHAQGLTLSPGATASLKRIVNQKLLPSKRLLPR